MKTAYITITTVMIFITCLAQAESLETAESIESAVEELRAEMIERSLRKLVSSCENATASLLISKDPEQYHRYVFDVAYEITNVVSRRKPKSTDDMEWFEQKLPFSPFRLKSGSVEVIRYKAWGMGFVILEGRIYKNGIHLSTHSMIRDKMLRFRG